MVSHCHPRFSPKIDPCLSRRSFKAKAEGVVNYICDSHALSLQLNSYKVPIFIRHVSVLFLEKPSVLPFLLVEILVFLLSRCSRQVPPVQIPGEVTYNSRHSQACEKGTSCPFFTGRKRNIARKTARFSARPQTALATQDQVASAVWRAIPGSPSSAVKNFYHDLALLKGLFHNPASQSRPSPRH